MEKEQVAVDETVETVVEQNTRAYSKTVWNESTPITADKLNKIEDGIANALDTTTGGTVKGKLTVKGNIQSDGGNFYSNKNGGNKPVIEVFDGDKNGSAVVYSAGGLTVLAGGESGSLVVQNTNNTDEHAVVSADQGVILYANLQNGWENRKTVELTKGGRFKLNNNSLELSPNNSGYARMGIDGDSQDVFISNINNNWFRLKGDKTITYGGHKVYTAFDKPTAAEIGALPISGGTMTGNIAFSNLGTGGGLNANIHNLALHSNTGNGQMMTADRDRIYVGNPQTHLTIESKTNPNVNVDGRVYELYHTGNVSPLPLAYENGYYGMKTWNGWSLTNDWIRTTSNGIIPYQTANGSWGGANSSLGTSQWRFANGYMKEIYCNGLQNDLGDLWLSSKPNDGNAAVYIQSRWLCPSTNTYTYLGSSGFRWHTVWAANGAIQTSDERFKVKQGFTDIEECYEMIKDTDIYNYIMLNQNKEDLSKNRLGKLALNNSQEQVNVHMGIMAQDIQKYKCSKQILVEGDYERADGSTDTMLSINPYGLTTAVMGALKVEIQKRELLEEKITKLESLVEQLTTQLVK